MSNPYEPIPSRSSESSSGSSTSSNANTHAFPPRARQPVRPQTEQERERLAHFEARFERPPVAWWKRALLIVGLIAMMWASIWLGRRGRNKKPEIIYASRYSDEFKYRPAASPVITEHLKDGRIRLRGASIGGVGVKENDIPLTPAQKEKKDKERREEAKNAARAKMGLKPKQKKKEPNIYDVHKARAEEAGLLF
ncbi:hypothetical protein L198_02069 [Cryptococcus wingfieldii CBS 7118]|uniref:Uncharacterized protein n=1 Tax=Cryptococcus wingfieldii CBS 7118 TaxID=1295528 RepID=A0A1E3JX91_9TREE|nr:hypothetical protein L198_02069 [Cryptococcus wingfieldii CBS 7118]ODO05376.1 hypothetical protein L198_02069 [Cryptococcus wingfieldii CBS 7118]